MSEYFMLVTKAMWEHDPQLVMQEFRRKASRDGYEIDGEIEIREQLNRLAIEKTSVLALLASVRAKP